MVQTQERIGGVAAAAPQAGRQRDFLLQMNADPFGDLRGLKKLRTLQVGLSAITDRGLAFLKDLTNLEELDLGETRGRDGSLHVTDAGLVHPQP